MLITFFIVLGIVLLCFLLLGVRVLFVKGGKFPNSHIEGNDALKKKGIHCASGKS